MQVLDGVQYHRITTQYKWKIMPSRATLYNTETSMHYSPNSIRVPVNWETEKKRKETKRNGKKKKRKENKEKSNEKKRKKTKRKKTKTK